jgi:hypothetical protein
LYRISAVLFCVIACLAGFTSGQTPGQVSTIVSPEVHQDRTVTFRLYAPKASKVDIAGEWILANNAETMGTSAVPMSKDAKGVWTIVFGRYFVNEVMPYVEANYRVAPGRGNRAVAGLSMGSSTKPGCAENSIADGIRDLVNQILKYTGIASKNMPRPEERGFRRPFVLTIRLQLRNRRLS